MDMIEAPVKTIKVEVNPAPMRAGLPHGQIEVIHPLITVVLGVTRLIVVAVRPRKVEPCSQLKEIKLFHSGIPEGSIAEEWVLQFSGTVVPPEAKAEAMFGNIRVTAASALKPHPGVDLKSRF